MKLLEKGEKTDLTKGTGLTLVKIGCGWDPQSNGNAFDVDASALILDQDEMLITPKHLVYYGNEESPEKFVVHSGDNLTGEGDGDDEVITVDFSKAPATAKEVLIIANVYKGKERGQNFGKIKNCFIRVFDTNNVELIKFDLSEDASTDTAVVLGKLYLHNGEWKFQAIGEGSKEGLDYYNNKHSR